MRVVNLAVALCTVSGALFGCGDDGADGGGGSSGTGDATATATATSSDAVASSATGYVGSPGQAPKAAYPAGPYGVNVGSVVPDFTWVGYTQPHTSRATLEVMSLADYYNPTGDGVFPDDGRAWAGLPKPKVLAVVVAAVWCQPCQQEARYFLPANKLQYEAQGGGFLQLISDGGVPGTLPDIGDLDAWTTRFSTSFPAALDASLEFQRVWEADAFPENIMIRTTDMRIIAKEAGAGFDCTLYTNADACSASSFCQYVEPCGDSPVAQAGCYAVGCESNSDCGGSDCNPASFAGEDDSCQDAPPNCDRDTSPPGTEKDINNYRQCVCEQVEFDSYWKTFGETLGAL